MYREGGVDRHQLGGAGVVDLGSVELGDSAVSLDDELGGTVAPRHCQKAHENVGCPDPTIGAHRQRGHREPFEHHIQLIGHDPHHRAACGVEGARRRVRQIRPNRPVRSGAHLLGRRQGLDPRDVGTAGLQPGDLLFEDRCGAFIGECAQRFEKFAGRTDRTGDNHRAIRRVSDLSRKFGCQFGQGKRAILRVVELEPTAVATERVRQDDVGSRIDELLMKALHPIGVIDVPELGRLTGLQTHRKVVCAGRSVGEEHASGCEKVSE